MSYIPSLFLGASLALTSGCVTSKEQWKLPASAFIDRTQSAQQIRVQELASEHPLYTLIPRHREQIPTWAVGTWTTWALGGNDEDGLFGERGGYSHAPSYSTALLWGARNPLHNMTFHVLGSAGKTNHTSYSILELGSQHVGFMHPTVPATSSSESCKLGLHLHDAKPFLFLNFPVWKNRELQFYAGWRERGNLGFALRPFQKRKK